MSTPPCIQPAMTEACTSPGWCRDEAACGQARAADGAGILAAQLFDVASQTDAESTLWDSSRVDESASQLAEALTTLVEVHAESQARLQRSSPLPHNLELTSCTRYSSTAHVMLRAAACADPHACTHTLFSGD
jgi:hypothetical protein